MQTVRNESEAQFLLGKLSVEEQTAIEKEYFNNTESFEKILIAENDLVDAYVSDRLTAEDRALFEKRLLITPKQRQRADFASTLIRYASSLQDDNVGNDRTAPKWTAIFGGLFSVRPILSYSLAAAVLVLIAGGSIWLTYYRPTGGGDSNFARTDANAEYDVQSPISDNLIGAQDTPQTVTNDTLASIGNGASKVEKSSTRRTDVPVTKQRADRLAGLPSLISTIVLQAGTTRDSGGGNIFVVPKTTSQINLRLIIDEYEFSSYFAVVETADGQQVWRGKVMKTVKDDRSPSVAIKLPARRLPHGDYIVSLKGLTHGGIYEAVADYAFTLNDN